MVLRKIFNVASRAVLDHGQQPKTKTSEEISKLAFQITNTSPKTDNRGRVIVKLKNGSDVTIPVHTYKMKLEAGNKLAGKPKEDEEFDKSVRVRVSIISNQKGAEETRVELLDGSYIGVVKRESAEFAATLFEQIASGLKLEIPELADSVFVFDVSANIIGEWQDDENDEGEPILFAKFTELNLKVKAPISAEVE